MLLKRYRYPLKRAARCGKALHRRNGFGFRARLPCTASVRFVLIDAELCPWGSKVRLKTQGVRIDSAWDPLASWVLWRGAIA